MKQKLLSLLVTFVTMFVCLSSASAWTRTCKITVNATEGGVVYVSNENSDESAQYGKTASVTGNISGSTLGRGSITQYLFAKANVGYEFIGWATSEDASRFESTNANYAVTTTIYNANGNQTKTYYAFFKKIENYYTKGLAVIYGNVGGSVYVSKESGNFEGATNSATNYQVTTTPSADTYYFKAEAEEGYVFDAWYTNAECTQGRNANSEITATVTSESTDQNSPTTVTRYAKFLKLETYYVNAKAVAKEGGLVYVSNVNGSNNSTYEPAQVSNNSQDNVTSYSATIYFRAKPIDGYVFEGWYTDEQCSQKTNKSQNFNEQVTGTTENTTHVTYYANFIYSTYYSKVTANGSADGNVFVSAKNTSEPSFEQTSSKEIREQAEPNPTHTYYLYAQANDGKAFQGWRYNNSIVSYDNPLKVEITNPSTSNTATSRTYTAVFGELSNVWRWKTEEPTDGNYYLLSSTNVWLKSPSDINYEVSANENERTLFVIDAGNSESLKIGFEKNGSVVYMRENDGNTQEATSTSTTFYTRESDGQYYIVDNIATLAATIGSWAGLVGRYFDIDSNNSNSCHFPKASTGNRTRWNFISPVQFDMRDAYITAWDAANALTADKKSKLSSEASAQLTEYLTKETNFTNAAEVTAILNALCKAAEGEARSTASGKYGTICLPYAFTATGADVYSVSGYNSENHTLILESVDSPAAGVPYIYKATESSQSFEMAGGKCVVDPVEDTYLVGLISDLSVPANAYVLQTQAGVQGFYKVASDAKGQAYRCYLKDSSDYPTEVKGLTFSVEESTAIEAISTPASEKTQSIYTPNGIKVDSLQKGLNIIKMSDGSVKKVMVK